jgi:hypothetical protein
MSDIKARSFQNPAAISSGVLDFSSSFLEPLLNRLKKCLTALMGKVDHVSRAARHKKQALVFGRRE